MKNRTINNRRWFSGMLVKKPYEKKKKVQDRPDHLCVVPPPKLFQLEWFRDGWFENVGLPVRPMQIKRAFSHN